MKFVSAAFLALCSTAVAAEPGVFISHSGRLTEANDALANGEKQVQFTIYKNPAPPQLGGTDDTWWTGRSFNVQVSQGLYAAILGDPTTTGELPASAFRVPGLRWLQVTVAGQALLPRLLLAPSPLAAEAAHAAEADALSANCTGCVGSTHLGAGAVTEDKLAADVKAKLSNGDAVKLGGHAAAEFLLADGSVPLTGALTLPGAPTAALHAATKAYVDAQAATISATVSSTLLPRDGSVALTGPLSLAPAAPTLDAHAVSLGVLNDRLSSFATKAEVGQIIGANGTLKLGGTTLDEPTLVQLVSLLTPTLVAPADNATAGTNGTVTLQWRGINGPFLVEVTSVADGGGQPVFTGTLVFSGETTLNAQTVTGLNGAIWWRVTAKGASPAKVSAVRKLTVPNAPGSEATNALATCQALKTAGRTVSGKYWINPYGTNPAQAVEVWCDQEYDEGGWTTIINTRNPGNVNVDKRTSPIGDMAVRDPAIANAAIWKFPGTWSEILFECRNNASDTPFRWALVKSQQNSTVNAGLDDLVANARWYSTQWNSSGNNVASVKGRTTSFKVGHNNAGSETEWGDGLSLGTGSSSWVSQHFGNIDAQGFKCDTNGSFDHNASGGRMPAAGIVSVRIR